VSVTVVTGGTRSGKSAHAEALATATGLPVRYVATGHASMGDRITAHVARRPASWTTVDVGEGSLADAVRAAAGMCVLLDGLGPWLSTQLHLAGAFEDPSVLPAAGASVLAEVDRAVAALAGASAAIVVAEQAGSGVHPPDAASRVWVDLLGAATQRFVAVASEVVLVVAGRPIRLGGPEGDRAHRGLRQAPPAEAALRRHGDRDVRPGDADHAVNVVAGGPPPWLQTALEDALATVADTYPREEKACDALAALHGRDAHSIVPTNGGAEALWLLAPALRPALAAVVHPQFTEAEAALHAHGIPVVRVQRDPDEGFALNPGDVPEDADLVVVGNPASPSGTLDPATAILALRRPGRTIVVDEAFMDLVPGEPGSLVTTPLDDVIVIRSLTKVLSIPGLRAGYAVAPPALADRLRAVRPPWSANALALAALTAAARHWHEVAQIAARAAGQRADLERRLHAIDGLQVWPGAANFVLVAHDDGPALVQALRARRIAVRPAASFPGLDDRHVRITAREPASNARVADAIRAAIGVPA
jgi:histidinol-phosphate/aromatic aminotransferase/cobyric acid decarboxylase-like protein/adenosyl cobinamide kinase/adenosyl cobinamide phosphate guanylyltransferase